MKTKYKDIVNEKRAFFKKWNKRRTSNKDEKLDHNDEKIEIIKKELIWNKTNYEKKMKHIKKQSAI